MQNSAFVFVKPHANNEKVRNFAKEFLEKKGLKIVKEGDISSEQIAKGKLVDTHYGSIAAKAVSMAPSQLNIPLDKFEKKFGMTWKAALETGDVCNAAEAVKRLGVDAKKMNELWAVCKKSGNMEKFGGGFYCGKVTHDGKTVYTFNGFYMDMREEYVAEGGAGIHYFVVDFDPKELSWEQFRGDVLGATDPAAAKAGSLRNEIFKQYKSLDLTAEPNTGLNSVHASASPFEALAEKANWLKTRVNTDAFGKALLEVCPLQQVLKWFADPQVTYAVGPLKVGPKSLFDSVEDMNVDDCLIQLHLIAGSGAPAVEKLQKENEKLKKELESMKKIADAVKTLFGVATGAEEGGKKGKKGEGKKGAKGAEKGGEQKEAKAAEEKPKKEGGRGRRNGKGKKGDKAEAA